jgi:hypothetical protein
VQAVLSLLVTERVKGTAEPAATATLDDGERLTAGFARVHGIATTYVADAVVRKVVAPRFFAVPVNP